MMKENFVAYMENSIRKNWKLPAFTDYGGATVSYGDVGRRIYKIQAAYRTLGIKRGDTIALLGRNSADWATAYLATVTYGAVIVPILPDFRPSDIETIVKHSDAKLLFTTSSYFERLDKKQLGQLRAVFNLEDWKPFMGDVEKALEESEKLYKKEYEPKLNPGKYGFERVPNEALLSIVYTSGTTGFSKGVMLTHNNFISNLTYSWKNVYLYPGDPILSFLPLAHSFGCAFELVFPFSRGCHITFLNKVPSTSLLIEAFAKIKPRLILTVPLVIEKIYYKQVRPMLATPKMQRLLKVPLLKHIIYRKIRDKLHNFFGGNMIQVIIGGASFNPEVEAFLKKVHFRYTLGYGMTECAPLITYVGWKEHQLGSVGHMVDYMEAKLMPVPGSEHRELWVRGENVMKGYYKNPEETARAIDRDGWLHTGDLATATPEGIIYIRGRCKTMILNSSGQNIYPEEIEARLNNLPYVGESLVLEEAGGKLCAMVYPDQAEAKKAGLNDQGVLAKMQENLAELNRELPEFMRVSRIELQMKEFEKTPTNKIKRYLYVKQQ